MSSLMIFRESIDRSTVIEKKEIYMRKNLFKKRFYSFDCSLTSEEISVEFEDFLLLLDLSFERRR